MFRASWRGDALARGMRGVRRRKRRGGVVGFIFSFFPFGRLGGGLSVGLSFFGFSVLGSGCEIGVAFGFCVMDLEKMERFVFRGMYRGRRRLR